MMKITKVCKECGSDDIIVDAWLNWNIDKQDWETNNIFSDNCYCTSCNAETNVADKKIEDE